MAIQQLLNQYFLNPLGLIGILGIIPLIIFYLTRPEPERKVMPSMEFFQEDERRSKLRNALKKLQNNIVLILNILSILLLSLGIAGLYMQKQGEDQTIIIYDRSVSMQQEHAEAVSTVLSKASERNTVIIAGETVEVYEGMNRQQAADIVREKDPIYQKSDMTSALQQAELYSGSIILLSNLDTSNSLIQEYKDLGSERGLTQIDYSTENKWGIVDIGNGFVEIKNYRPKEVKFEISVNSNETEINLKPDETMRFETEFLDGKNTVELSQDDFPVDNTVYIYNPEREKLDVEYHGPENFYLSTALEAIDTVERNQNGDVVILNEGNEEILRSDKPSILMQGSSDLWNLTKKSSEEIRLDSPYSITFETEIYDLEPSNNSISSPKNAIFRNSSRFYYNVQNEDLSDSFVYPIIWKDMIHELKSPKTFENSNKEVKNVKHNSPGFYQDMGVNYLGNPSTEFHNIENSTGNTIVKEDQSSQIALIVLLMLTLETLILLDRGVYR